MRIADKMDGITAGRKTQVTYIADGSIANHLTTTPRKRANYLFEEGSFIQSPWKLPESGAFQSFIGRFSYVNSGGFIRNRVLIGRYCSIGQRVSIAAGKHNMSHVSTHPKISKQENPYTDAEANYLGIKSGPSFTRIENDVWIGDGAIVMPGVTIGSGSVIAANAVVTKDVAPYAIMGGVPARIIRSRFPNEISERLLRSRWWDFSADALGKLPTDNVFKFLDAIERTEQDIGTFQTYSLKI
jgi:virginiamycin A acetyltransferase